MSKPRTSQSYIEQHVREYTAEMVGDALESETQDPIEVAAAIAEQIQQGFLSAMEEQGQREIALKILQDSQPTR